MANAKLIEMLNALLALERTGIDQYKIHRAKFVNWQLAGQVPYFDDRIGEELGHQEFLEDRILFLGGTIIPQVINEVHVGIEIPAIFDNDEEAEIISIATYNEAIALAVSVGDEDTADKLRFILSQETDHLNDIVARKDQMRMAGVQNWIAINIRSAA